MSKTGQKHQDQDDAIEMLRGIFPAGSRVAVSIRHVSSSGMSRAITVLSVENGEIRNVSGLVARAIGWKLHPRHEGVKVTGTGMDMGFHLVYTLGHVLHDDGYALTHAYV